MKIAIRVDSSLWIGSGHVMRCLVLAEVLRTRKWEVEFICQAQDGSLTDFILNKGFVVKELRLPFNAQLLCSSSDYRTWLPHSEEQDARMFIDIVGSVDWVIVDHYSLGATWERLVRQKIGCHLLSIDDLDRKHESSLILDQNLWPELESRYWFCKCQRLLGPEYALLRHSFKALRKDPPKRRSQMIAFFGGTDPTLECSKLLTALSKIPHLPFYTIVVTGLQNNKHVDLVTEYAALKGVKITRFIENFELELASSKYAIGASGISNWERFCLSIPATIVSVADNQKTLSSYLSQKGLVSYLGDGGETTPESYIKELCRIADNWDAIRPFELINIDGYGADRVVSVMESF
ncbi:UDP-2,4-diacetamido-2,4,6-trideoxy-beta-L-altropyranose hydrolase [Vibrio europaeus]|uniref:UDP-2,4-diacetamido-2,4, 6-trideoxy-beta-L-altropyranose hydrolase n=1 Tax=Vibrio europaeus TaxID=300876 RepID=UPI0039E19AB2